MGRAKLLLPIGRQTVIARVLGVLRRPDLERPVVVVRPDDEPLRAAVEESGGTPLQPPVAPPEMRSSVEFALRWIEREFQPAADDAWILMPADHPLFDAAILEQLIARWRRGDCTILVPTCEGHRGHPVFFRWGLAADVFELPADVGLNELVRRHAAEVVELETGNRSVTVDLDTPEDYQSLLAEH